MKNRTTFSSGGGINRHIFDDIISFKNLFRAWNEFKQGKIKKQDVANFSEDIERHIFELHDQLTNDTYRHSKYSEFHVFDPKRRHIHKASVKDRLFHHAIFRVLELIYDKKFIFDSYSSRQGKGTHRAIGRFRKFAWKLSRNNTRTVWILKCDIRKFFDSVDHRILLVTLAKTVTDERAMELLRNVIHSFETNPGKGIPLGNLTSQLFSNVYLDVFDQFAKRTLRIKHYVRYADDFVIMDTDRALLTELLPKLAEFLGTELGLSIHPHKVHIRKFSQGVDFLGYVIFPHHQVLRTKTKRRVLTKVKKLAVSLQEGEIAQDFFDQSIASYYSLLEHCKGKGIRKSIEYVLNDKSKNTS